MADDDQENMDTMADLMDQMDQLADYNDNEVHSVENMSSVTRRLIGMATDVDEKDMLDEDQESASSYMLQSDPRYTSSVDRRDERRTTVTDILLSTDELLAV